MKMKRLLSPRPAIILLVPVLLLLSACIPDSKYPLPPPADGKGDDRLIGRWVSMEEDEKGYADISSSGGGRYLVRIVDKPDRDEEARYEILTTAIGDRWYMSILPVGRAEDTSPKTRPYMIAIYDISGEGILSIRLMSWEALAEDVRAGRVAGKVESGKDWDDVLLTAESEALSAYVAAADPERIFRGTATFMARRP